MPKLETDLRRIEEARTKSAANIRRKGEIEEELRIISNNISHLKNKLREMNALHFY